MITMVSGCFDPLHIGHLDYLEGAKFYGDVIVALNSDEWLFKKKGYVFMPFADRERILIALEVVTAVTPVNDYDGTVCEAIKRIRPDSFCNGGDRTGPDPREDVVCRELGIFQIFKVGGEEKVRSSSQLVSEARL